jgi:hypothetical protein
MLKLYKVELLSPGIVIEVPTSSKIVRTPYVCYSDQESVQLWENIIRLRGITNYKITVVEGEELEKVVNAEATVTKKTYDHLKKLGSDSINMNFSFTGK